MGGAVTASLAEQASQLVDRAVMIDMAPDTEDFGDGLPFLAQLGYTPVLGEAMWRLTPDFAIEDGFKEAFAPGYDIDEAFENPDQVVDDFRAMTYTSYDAAPAETDDYTEELPLDERFKQTPVPLLVIFGEEDQIFDAEESIEGYSDVPGVQTELIEGRRPRPPGRKARRGRRVDREVLVEPEISASRPKPPKDQKKTEQEEPKPGSDPKNTQKKVDTK